VTKEGLYIGRECDPTSMEPTAAGYFLKPDRLTRHAVCFGMTGSGKTGLCVSLLEELAMEGVPLIIIDPKGDMANLALGFSDHSPEQFAPWVDPGEAERRGVSVAEFAASTSEKWREGLADWGVSRERVKAFVDRAAVTVYTPGSQSGIPVDVMSSLHPPGQDLDDEGLVELVAGTISGLLGLVDVEADPVRDPRHIVMSTILEQAWRKGESLSLEDLILHIVDPPFAKVGVFPVDTFFARKDRMELAMRLNGVVASPSFSGWKKGVALEPATLLKRGEKTPVSIFYLAHLDDQQRVFFISLLLNRMVAWSRRQPGTGALRALLYFDEVFGYLPPYPKNPATKGPILTLMKQARAVGLGTMVVTQNPVDVDYAALSNSGLWLVGRLQTKQDRARVLDGLELAGSGIKKSELDSWLERLPSRRFLIRDIKESEPNVVHSRWAISYLRGPLTRREVEQLDGTAPPPPGIASALAAAPESAEAPPQKPAPPVPEAAPRAVAPVEDGLVREPPSVPAGYGVRFLDPDVVFSARLKSYFEQQALPRREDGATHWKPAVYARLQLRFDEGTRYRENREEFRLFFPVTDAGMALAGEPNLRESELMDQPLGKGVFDALPQRLDEHREFKRIEKRIVDQVLDGETTSMFRLRALSMASNAGESIKEFRLRVRERLKDETDADIRKLQGRHAKQVERLEHRRERLLEDNRAQKKRADADFMSEIASAGDVLLNTFMGRKRRGGGISNVMRRHHAAKRSSDRVDETETRIEELEREIYDLERDVEREMERIRSGHLSLLTEVETVPIRLEREDIRLLDCLVVWVPVTRSI
jgi:hypothetical protein